MSNMEISQVLAQIRALSAQASVGVKPATQALGAAASGVAAGTATAPAGGAAFGDLLKRGIDAVNQSQQSANAVADAWERGDSGVDLARVMLETQKANVSFRALTEVRNRLVTAYQDIMNMPI